MLAYTTSQDGKGTTWDKHVQLRPRDIFGQWDTCAGYR